MSRWILALLVGLQWHVVSSRGLVRHPHITLLSLIHNALLYTLLSLLFYASPFASLPHHPNSHYAVNSSIPYALLPSLHLPLQLSLCKLYHHLCLHLHLHPAEIAMLLLLLCYCCCVIVVVLLLYLHFHPPLCWLVDCCVFHSLPFQTLLLPPPNNTIQLQYRRSAGGGFGDDLDHPLAVEFRLLP